MMPERVLIHGMTEKLGGREKFIMELYRRLDKSRIQFDFVCDNRKGELVYEEEILSSGGQIFVLPPVREKPLTHLRRWKELYRSRAYRAVYCHANRKPKYAAFFRYARQAGVPIRILHSHNSDDLNNRSAAKKMLERIAAAEWRRSITHRFACSRRAGEWMFGKNTDFRVIPNAIDTERFDLNAEKRESLRTREGAAERKVYGTVARISPEKNPLFLAEVFCEIRRLQPDSLFWLVGEGDLEAELRDKLASLGLTDAVRLLGRKENVDEYLNGMDVFMLPSVHEGFPITLVEAQASGLPCLVSDAVTEEVAITDSVVFLPLSAGPQEWAEKAIALSSRTRTSQREALKRKGYDLDDLVSDFTAFILGEPHPQNRTYP